MSEVRGGPGAWRVADAVTVVLVRHGRTAHNAERRFLGRTDVPLDEVGVEQARRIGAALEGVPDAVVTSPLLRARQTAARIGPAAVVPELVELDQGELEGLTGPEALARFPEFFEAWRTDPACVPVPGGERLVDLASRADTALARIVAGHAPGAVVVAVSHQMVIATLGCRAVGSPLGSWRHHTVRNGSATVLRRVGHGWRRVVHDWLPGVDPGGESVLES